MDYLAGIEQTVATALAEDIGDGDITALLIAGEKQATAKVIARGSAIVCGRPWADEVMRQVNPAIHAEWMLAEGDAVNPGDLLFRLSGPARSMLTAERTALNFLQTLSGTATRTRAYVDLVRDTGVTLLDTRKTLPGLRLAQKYAVKTGGAENHRVGLFDAFLIKENHIKAAGSITDAISKARRIRPGSRIEVEVETRRELQEAIDAGPDWIMLDNFSLENILAAVELRGDADIKLEASGDIATAEALKKVADTGVDFISMGALTKHCKAIDLSMRME